MSTTHPSLTAGRSQCDLILAYLQDHPGQWVELPTLVHISGGFAVHSRIADLRARGHIIAHKNERQPLRRVHSFYKLDSLSASGGEGQGEVAQP